MRLSLAISSLLETRAEIVGRKSDFIFPARTKSGHIEDTRITASQSTNLAKYRESNSHKEADKIGTHIWRDTYISLAPAAGVARDDTKRLVDHSVATDAHSAYESDSAARAYLVSRQTLISNYLLESAKLGADFRFTRDMMDSYQMI